MSSMVLFENPSFVIQWHKGGEITADAKKSKGHFADRRTIGWTKSTEKETRAMYMKWLRRHDPNVLARKWCAKLGLGFHPDTRGDQYTPPLSAAQVRSYEQDMRFLFQFAADPYATCVAEMESLGLTKESAQ